MQLSFRWFGPDDPVPLAYIRQIPGMRGVVSALYDLPAGEIWPGEELVRLGEAIDGAGLAFTVVESIPVHEDIKLGRPERERWIDRYCESVRNVGELGVAVVCYNFMPVFDWVRSRLDLPLDDGSTTLAYDPAELARSEATPGVLSLPGWMTTVTHETIDALLTAYRGIDDEALWENLAFFLDRVVPAAEAAGVRMAIHPDDPPWPIFGLPRIITSGAALERVVALHRSPANGVTFCTGSLGADPANDLPAMIRSLGPRVHFAHCRNVQVTGERRFYESAHPISCGSVDMLAVISALHDAGFDGPLRPDHGRMIWGETGRAGYGLYDRALGATYLQGLWDAVARRADTPSATAPEHYLMNARTG